MHEFALKKMKGLDKPISKDNIKKSEVKKYMLSILQDYEVPDSVTVGGIEWEVKKDAGSWSGKTSCYYEHTEPDGPTGIINVDIFEGKIYGKIDNIRESVSMTTSPDGVYEDVIAMGEALTDIWNKNTGEGVGKSKSKKSDVNKTVGIEEAYTNYFDKVSESDLMDSIYDNDFQIYKRLMNSLTDASHYIESGEYSYASECLSDFTRILDEINSDWDIEQFDLDELVEIQRKLLATGKSKTRKSEVKKSDGWDMDDFYDYDVFDDIYNVHYELEHCVRGSETGCHTYKELAPKIRGFAERLESLANDLENADGPYDDEDEDDEYDEE